MRCRWCRCEGQAWGMRGAVPPAAWAFAILVASDMLFLRRFPGEFAPFAFSQCVASGLTLRMEACPISSRGIVD